MESTLAVARREFRTFFSSPIASIVLGGFLLLAGWLYFSTLFLAGQASLRGFFGVVLVLFVVLVPAITMRALAEERKSGTLELLLTLPMEDWQIVAGKFLAALGMVAVGLAWTLPYALSVAALTGPGAAFDWGPVFAGYFGLVLCFAFAFIDKFAALLPESLGQVFEFLAVDYHFDNIARGVLDTRDLIFYLSLTAVGLLMTTRTLSSQRQ